MIKKHTLLFGSMLLGVGAYFIYGQNKGLSTQHYEYENKALPESFDGYRILHVSDLHSTWFGVKQRQLIKQTRTSRPDSIIITGDLFDCHRMELEPVVTYIKEAVQVAPVYYVAGNHEGWRGDYPELRQLLRALGVNILDDKAIELQRHDGTIRIIGLQDKIIPDTDQVLERYFKDNQQSERFTVLLSHRPEYLDVYAKYPIDLVFTGHAHGGQIRLPLVGGLYAPGQGIVPTYTKGSYIKYTTTMYVSRGLGNSRFPIRIFNTPELLLVTLRKS